MGKVAAGQPIPKLWLWLVQERWWRPRPELEVWTWRKWVGLGDILEVELMGLSDGLGEAYA